MGVKEIRGGFVDSLTDGRVVREWPSREQNITDDANVEFEIGRWEAILASEDSDLSDESRREIRERLDTLYKQKNKK